MRLWSLHPRYLDPQGLVALWREALLAKAVLQGRTRGYTQHPQLERFKAHARPVDAIEAYLAAVHAQAAQRGYRFDAAKLGRPAAQIESIAVTQGQLMFEWAHLQAKLAARSPAVHEAWREEVAPACHPMFQITPGPVAAWERAAPAAPKPAPRPSLPPQRGR